MFDLTQISWLFIKNAFNLKHFAVITLMFSVLSKAAKMIIILNFLKENVVNV